MNLHLFAGFLLITVVLLLTPGPIVTLGDLDRRNAWRARRTGDGRRYLALATPCCWRRSRSALSLLLGHAVYLFELLRWAGVAYLIWLGVRAWRNAGRPHPLTTGNHVQFWRGFLVALSNPKTLAFFTAFLPQFVDPTRPAARQLAVMCAVTVLLAALSDSCWAIASGLGKAWFMTPARARLLGRASGLTLIGGGIWLSLARRPA